MDKLYHLATAITASVGSHGSSVLIFVPGMSGKRRPRSCTSSRRAPSLTSSSCCIADIEAIIELIEQVSVNDAVFICMPIHSDVPFEEQMAAFEPAKAGEVKVIIATNAAESSLTLPDVDHGKI